ncbi:transaldolase family protein [Streptomyces lincolnensis]|uniref:transaldolase family protein n=1 Tax=Streptomyces lincolnensis TaxID=1915 RepID=UPI0037D260F1
MSVLHRPPDRAPAAGQAREPDGSTGLSVLERLQRTNRSAEIWWDSPPLDFPAWRDEVLSRAPGPAVRRRWAAQFERFMTPNDPEGSLVRGVTTNPSLIAKSVLNAPQKWSREVRRQATQQKTFDPESVFRLIYREVVAQSAIAMVPMWQQTDGRYGWVSAQLDPRSMFDPDKMLDEALTLAQQSPNVMVKVPGTPAGYEVIRELVARAVSINNTLTYTVPQFLACVRAVEDGLAAAERAGIGTDRWRAVITHMIGRYGSNGDLLKDAEEVGVELGPLDVRWAEVAVLKRIQQILGTRHHPVKMLLSSLEVEDPRVGTDVVSMHLEQTAGADIAYTCKPAFVEATMRREEDLVGFAPDAIDQPVPPDVLARLNRLPYFRRAVEPDGMRPEQFADHGAFVTTRSEVNHNTRRLLDFIEHHIDELPVSVRNAGYAGGRLS